MNRNKQINKENKTIQNERMEKNYGKVCMFSMWLCL